MKEENEESWDRLESKWRDQLDKQEAPVPAFDWEKLDAVSERPTILLWRQLTESPWVWAAVLGLAIGINWQQVEPGPSALPAYGLKEKIATQASESVLVLQKEKKVDSIDRNIIQVSQPNAITPNPIQEMEVAKSTELPRVTEHTEEDAIFVRIDIDPIEENQIQPALEEYEKPIKRKRNLLGQILRQVIAGERGGWREIATSNEKLTEGIHQVANTVIRTEQSLKQTLQLQ
jgi:hypothetical protein